MQIPTQCFFKTDLVDDSGIIKATLPVSKGDFTTAAKPCSDFGDAGRVGDKAGCRQKQIVIHIVALQSDQAA